MGSKQLSYYRKRVIAARIHWMLAKMDAPQGTPQDNEVAIIAEYLQIPLFGKTISKKRRYISREIAKLRDCPSKHVLVGPRPNGGTRWDATKFDADHVEIPTETNPSEKDVLEFYASWEWKRLSYDAKIKFGRKCACCGATPQTGAVINTDHIKPIRKHWHLRLDSANLQILCNDCNMGKGSRDETNWITENVIQFEKKTS